MSTPLHLVQAGPSIQGRNREIEMEVVVQVVTPIKSKFLMHSQCYLKQPDRIITKATHPAHSQTYHRHTYIPRCLVCTSILEVLAHRVHQFHLSIMVASRPITPYLQVSSFLKVASGYGHLPFSNPFLYHMDTLLQSIQGFLHKLHPKWFMVRSLHRVCHYHNHLPVSYSRRLL